MHKIRRKVRKKFIFQIIGEGAWSFFTRGWLRPWLLGILGQEHVILFSLTIPKNGAKVCKIFGFNTFTPSEI